MAQEVQRTDVDDGNSWRYQEEARLGSTGPAFYGCRRRHFSPSAERFGRQQEPEDAEDAGPRPLSTGADFQKLLQDAGAPNAQL